MWVKKDLVSNENVPVEILKKMCNDKDVAFELALFTNNRELLKELSKSEDEQVKKLTYEKLKRQ
jgi:hypothetical protein